MTSITLRIPVDVVDSLKAIAPQRGFTGYQTLLKSYLSDGLRRDEAQNLNASTARLVQALKNRGVSAELIALAEQDLQKGQR
jgi:tRNA 2-selenouridine synthase SelU